MTSSSVRARFVRSVERTTLVPTAVSAGFVVLLAVLIATLLAPLPGAAGADVPELQSADGYTIDTQPHDGPDVHGESECSPPACYDDAARNHSGDARSDRALACPETTLARAVRTDPTSAIHDYDDIRRLASADSMTVTPDRAAQASVGRSFALAANQIAANAVSRIPANPSAYSVAYEMQLSSGVLGRSRSVHFNRANEALDDALRSDPAFAGAMEQMIPGVGSAVSRTGGRSTPDGWIWHHVHSSQAGGQAGVMRLVPDTQHAPGSAFWSVLHPGGVGGYSEWAIPRGAPPN